MASAKNSSTQRAVAQEKATSMPAKTLQHDDDDDDDPFASSKSPVRSDANGKGAASDAKNERLSDSKDCDNRK